MEHRHRCLAVTYPANSAESRVSLLADCRPCAHRSLDRPRRRPESRGEERIRVVIGSGRRDKLDRFPVFLAAAHCEEQLAKAPRPCERGRYRPEAAPTALAPQIRSQYSPMARSDENLPERAVFRIDIRVQRSGSWNASAARACAST